jgi:heterodisulfide reductase subunit A-like polyferredoxin
MMSYCVSITEQTMTKSYLFVLYNKNKKKQIHFYLDTLTFGNLKNLKFYKHHTYMIYINKGMLLATESNIRPTHVLVGHDQTLMQTANMQSQVSVTM